MKTDVCAATRYWIEQIIIGLNFCPFAGEVFTNNSIAYVPCGARTHEDILAQLQAECKRLDTDQRIATTLLIMTDGCTDFYEFLDCVDVANDLLDRCGYVGVYQLAHFHPDYCFAGADQDDVSNYTNRSPFPTLHIIRESDIERVLEHYPNPEQIPRRNIAVAGEHGVAYFENILQRSIELSKLR